MGIADAQEVSRYWMPEWHPSRATRMIGASVFCGDTPPHFPNKCQHFGRMPIDVQHNLGTLFAA
jgi:hypothetical protein